MRGHKWRGGGLRADSSVAEAASLVIGHQLARLQAAEEGSVRGDDAERVHQMRVAGRSLRVALRLFSEAVDSRDLKAVADGVRWLAELLGDVRDLDVSLEWLQRYHESAPEGDRDLVAAFVAETEAKRDGARVVLVEGLRSERYTRLKQGLSALMEKLESAPAAEGDLGSHAATAIREQYRRARAARRRARTGDTKDLHRLRIVCKRLRYTCEFLAAPYDDGLRPFIRACVAVQDSLGLARDAQVLRAGLREPYRQASGPRRQTLRRMRQQLRRQERASLKVYQKVAPELLGRRAEKRLARLLQGDEAQQGAER